MDSTVGQRIRAARKKQDKTQQEVADALGLARVSILQWEKDITNPAIPNLRKLCDYLHVDVEAILNGGAPSSEDADASTASYSAAPIGLLEIVRAVVGAELGFEPTAEQALRWLTKKAGVDGAVSALETNRS
jgi:transcriptional regulator with XRE-family HTH domain